MIIKILIIKLGYSETLDQEIGIVPSLGDVLRTTPILWGLKEKYPKSHISWLVSQEAVLLLAGNKMIDRILIWDDFMPFQIQRERFDVLINLEKISGICALADTIDAWVKYGFRFDKVKGQYHGYERGLDFLAYINQKKKNRKTKDIWQKILMETLGVKWNQQEYVLGYKPKAKLAYDVGLNFKVGSKWPSKAMSEERWKELGQKINACGYSVSWQQGLSDLCQYMDWLNSCRIIITCDSLGLHLAIALKKKIIGLFGPSNVKEVYMYNRGQGIYAKINCQRMPCYYPRCRNKIFCMDNIEIPKIIAVVKKMNR